jgi:hypothetical protein
MQSIYPVDTVIQLKESLNNANTTVRNIEICVSNADYIFIINCCIPLINTYMTTIYMEILVFFIDVYLIGRYIVLKYTLEE